MKLEQSQTFINLAKAYAGECQARVRYEFIEYGARNEGYNTLAEVIDKIVYNEFNHARMFYTKMHDADENALKKVEFKADYPFREKWNLLDNLKIASEDEDAEIKLYPIFAKTAKEEGFNEIATLFLQIAEIEKTHKQTFLTLYKQLKENKLYKKAKATEWVCSGCGYKETKKEAFKVCPVCQAKQGVVNLVLCDDSPSAKDKDDKSKK